MARLDQLKAQRIIYLTAGFIKGELNFAEQQELTKWKSESLENYQLFDELVNDDNRANAVRIMQQLDTEERLLHVKERMVLHTGRKRIIPYWFAAAAAIVIIGVSYLFIGRQVHPQLVTVNVPYGKILKITLPDSSKVYLNAGTTIQYPDRFNDATRPVLLKEGQAYFEIVHNASKPFVVTAKGMNVTVLGTSFEVTSLEKEHKAKVNVKSGKIGLQSIKQPVVFLVGGEQATVNEVSHQVYKSASNMDDVAAWRTQQLIFENEPLLSVMHTLERTYNVHIEVRNPNLKKERITTRFKNQTIDNVLTALSFSNHFKFSTANDNQLIVVN